MSDLPKLPKLPKFSYTVALEGIYHVHTYRLGDLIKVDSVLSSCRYEYMHFRTLRKLYERYLAEGWRELPWKLQATTRGNGYTNVTISLGNCSWRVYLQENDSEESIKSMLESSAADLWRVITSRRLPLHMLEIEKGQSYVWST